MHMHNSHAAAFNETSKKWKEEEKEKKSQPESRKIYTVRMTKLVLTN